MNLRWHQRWDPAVLKALGGLYVLLSLAFLPSGLLQKYPAFARLAAGGQLSGEAASPASPLYLLIHVAFPAGLVRWTQCAAGLVCLVLLYRIGRRLLDPLAGLIAAGLFAVSASVLVYSATLEPDFLLMACGLVGMWMVPGVLASSRIAALFGCALGLAFALRPTAGLIAVVLLGGLAAQAARSPTRRASLGRLALALAAVAFAGAAPLIAVQGLYSSPARGTMSPGTAFYDGNRPESIGVGITNPWLIKAVERQEGPGESLPDFAHVIYRRFARLDGGPEMTLGQIQEYWAGKSWAFARLEPVAFASGALRKAVFLLAGTEYHDIQTVRREVTSLARLPLLRHRWVFLLGLAGLLLAAWQGRVPWWLWTYWGAGAAGLVFFSVTTRYGLVLLPAVILSAALFLHGALSARSAKAVAGLGACLLLAALPGFCPPIRWDARVQQRVLAAHEHVEELGRGRGDLGAAMASYVAGQSYFPFLPSITDPRGLPFESRRLALEAARLSELRGGDSPADAFFQAILWQQAGDCDRALPAARRAAAVGFHTTDDSRLLDPHLLVAECLIEDGKDDEAMTAILASLEAHPATADGLAMAIAGARSTGRSGSSVQFWEDRLSGIHDSLSATFSLMRAYRLWGEISLAFDMARSLRDRLSAAAVVEYELGLLHAEAGEAELAFEALLRARTLDPALPLRLTPFRQSLDRLIATSPDNRAAWVAKIDEAAQAGRFTEAAEVAAKAAQRYAADPEIQQLRLMMSQMAEQLGDLVA